MSKIIELAKKIKALADRGIGGEKINAETMLKKLMEKHNISLDQIEIPDRHPEEFKCKPIHKNIFLQVVWMLRGSEVQIYGYKGKRNSFIIDCTHAEHIELDATFDFYSKAFDADFEIFEHAFIQKNRLLPHDAPISCFSEMTDKEVEEARAVMELVGSMNSHTYRKQIKQ